MPSSFFKLFTHELAAGLDPAEVLSALPDQDDDDPSPTIGLLATPELEGVIAECKSNVARIAKQCKARNLRYRDVDFDIGNERGRCLNGLVMTEPYNPSDVQRVTQLFENPQFFLGAPYSNEIIQGQCANCWFISALAATSTVEGLVEKYCVARDEQCGVYGFVFWRDVRWVSVIVDDLLYTSVPKYEELSIPEKALFQNDKDRYNTSAPKGSHTLYFSRSGKLGETWISLVEKAYAKVHGDYGSLSTGYCSEGVEDLTGGVSSFIQSKDILDKDKFWKDELSNANRDRIFACSFQGLNPARHGDYNATISGIRGKHSYAVLKTLEYKGKRFLMIRNPSGHAGWTGPWSDGSKEWTSEWMGALPLLGHAFGDAGKFVMEYTDFLSCFTQVDRTKLFDSSWTMRHEVLRISSRPFPSSAFGYGDLCFSFSLSKTTFTIIVLSQLDARYFKGLTGPPRDLNFNFILYKKGQTEPVDTSSQSPYTSRSISLEFPELEAGEYVVHCRLDKVPMTDNTSTDGWSQSKLVRVLGQRIISESVATSEFPFAFRYAQLIIPSSDVQADLQEENMPIPLNILAGQDLADLARKASNLKTDRMKLPRELEPLRIEPECPPPDVQVKEDLKADMLEDPDTTKTITTTTVIRGPTKMTTDTKEIVFFGPAGSSQNSSRHDDDSDTIPGDPEPREHSRPSSPAPSFLPPPPPPSDTPFLGLKIYTSREVSVYIKGQLRHDMRTSFEGLTAADWNSLAI
ncbi:cysteine proteinase [Mycena metata]|uniref:Cysteine proteinase n=1 Tax=Mycena metata TaxID=1033252 RepID=A0AAD7HGH5_9AGAR|nr:cysteine proteinase [Mycena metata]